MIDGKLLQEWKPGSIFRFQRVRPSWETSVGLDVQEVHECGEEGTLLKIPFQTNLNARDAQDETLERTVVKAPASEN